MNLSVVILAKNEEKSIARAINSVKFADEIVVIDDKSQDSTKTIAIKHGAKVIEHELMDDFSKQRNFGLNEAKGRWVLFIDADEVVSQELGEEIMQLTNNSFIGAEGFYIKRIDYFFGRKIKYGEAGRTKLIRLTRKSSGKWVRPIHEKLKIKGRVKTLKFSIIHRPNRTLSEFLKDINQYSTLHARANRQEGKKSGILKIILWPSAHFVKNYLIKLGILDGTAGFVFALMMCFHSFLSWSKLWKLQRG